MRNTAYLSFALLAVSGCGAGADGWEEPTGTSRAATTVCGPMTVTGIDVYHGDNGGAQIDWSAVKSGGGSFGFAKATESTNFDDPMFQTNWTGMKDAGLVRGAYHFYDPAADPTAQANFFLAAVGTPSPGDLLVLDFETSGGLSDSALSSAAVTFLSTVQTATGLTPMLYASSAFLSDWGGLGVYPFWVANYGVMCPDVPSAWTTYTFWQSTGSGSFPGISGQVDVDYFNGTQAQLQALGGGTVVNDAGMDTSTGATDSGSDTGGNPVTDSGMVTVSDTGTGAGTDSGTGPTDSGSAGSTDSGQGTTSDSGHGPKSDASTASYPNSSKGCSCTTADRKEPSAPALGGLGFLLVLAGVRRRSRSAI